MKKNTSYLNNKGFTLLELMVALTLGLVITAAAVQVFISGLVSTRVHQANAEIQDSGILGLEFIARDIRLANHGNLNNLKIDDQTPWGGIVLTSGTSGNLPINGIDDSLLSHSQGDDLSTETNKWQGLSGVKLADDTEVQSDQLTVQFVAPEDTVNCEGVNVFAGDYIIQRYYLRPINNTQPNDLTLACDANQPAATRAAVNSKPTVLSGFGGAGEVLLPRVDHVRFYLGTWVNVEVAGSVQKRLTYYSIHDYKNKTEELRKVANAEIPRIVSVKIAALIRSADSTKNPHIDLKTEIPIFDQNILPKNQQSKYARQVYTTTAALRNALGDKI